MTEIGANLVGSWCISDMSVQFVQNIFITTFIGFCSFCCSNLSCLKDHQKNEDTPCPPTPSPCKKIRTHPTPHDRCITDEQAEATEHCL